MIYVNNVGMTVPASRIQLSSAFAMFKFSEHPLIRSHLGEREGRVGGGAVTSGTRGESGGGGRE